MDVWMVGEDPISTEQVVRILPIIIPRFWIMWDISAIHQYQYTERDMASIELLEGVLEGSQVPHQPLLIITETVTQSGLPLFTEVLRRSEHA